VNELRLGAPGEMAFASAPRERFALRISRIEPVAQATEHGNVVLVRCAMERAPLGWWRPGMSGVAKLASGPRTFWWIATHRTIDFLRTYFWW
jgi:hypothetical protein